MNVIPFIPHHHAYLSIVKGNCFPVPTYITDNFYVSGWIASVRVGKTLMMNTREFCTHKRQTKKHIIRFRIIMVLIVLWAYLNKFDLITIAFDPESIFMWIFVRIIKIRPFYFNARYLYTLQFFYRILNGFYLFFSLAFFRKVF